MDLYGTLERLILGGVREFLFRPNNTFDIICANTVNELKERYSHIVSILFLPFADDNYISDLYDYVVYPPIKKLTDQEINETMVDNADIILAYINHDKGKEVQTLNFARKQHKLIINIADET